LKRIGRITPQGAITESSAGITGTTQQIAPGPDGAMWFTEPDARIGKIAPNRRHELADTRRRGTGED
jgi:hypothetical protein